jgi:MerR family copper efflux transcriptional regulator
MMLAKPMTIGQVARRTGVSIKTLREYDRLALLSTRGRGPSNERLFDDTVWCCLHGIATLRSLGLTLQEIQDLTARCCDQPTTCIGPQLGAKLDQALTRVETRIAELHALRQRIRDFQTAHASTLVGQEELNLFRATPTCQQAESSA